MNTLMIICILEIRCQILKYAKDCHIFALALTVSDILKFVTVKSSYAVTTSQTLQKASLTYLCWLKPFQRYQRFKLLTFKKYVKVTEYTFRNDAIISVLCYV